MAGTVPSTKDTDDKSQPLRSRGVTVHTNVPLFDSPCEDLRVIVMWESS